MLDVAALGELLIDFTCLSTDENGYPTMAAHPGGAPANFLAALAKYGSKTAMLGKVGDDTFGRLLLDTLRRVGIETRGMIAAPDVFTTLAFVTLDENGERDFSFARKPGAQKRAAQRIKTVAQFDKRYIGVFPLGNAQLKRGTATVGCRHAVHQLTKIRITGRFVNLHLHFSVASLTNRFLCV